MPSINLEAVRQELINQLQPEKNAEQKTLPTKGKFANKTIRHIANTDNTSLNAFLTQQGSPSDLEAMCKQLFDREISYAAVTPIFLRAEGVRNAAKNVSALRIQRPYQELPEPLEK